MARTKSWYREKTVDKSAERHEETPVPRDLPPEAEPQLDPSTFSARAEKPAMNGAAQTSAEPGLADAMEQLRRANEVAQQQQAQIAQPLPPTREGRLDHLRKSGAMTEREERFLLEDPTLIDNLQITNAAAMAALASGFERDSPEYFAATKENYQRLMRRQISDTPEVFKPKPPTPSPAPTPPVSAPVSRRVPSSTIGQRPGQITLSYEQREAARISGVSEAEYARQLRALDTAKAQGRYAPGGT